MGDLGEIVVMEGLLDFDGLAGLDELVHVGWHSFSFYGGKRSPFRRTERERAAIRSGSQGRCCKALEGDAGEGVRSPTNSAL